MVTQRRQLRRRRGVDVRYPSLARLELLTGRPMRPDLGSQFVDREHAERFYRENRAYCFEVMERRRQLQLRLFGGHSSWVPWAVREFEPDEVLAEVTTTDGESFT